MNTQILTLLLFAGLSFFTTYASAEHCPPGWELRSHTRYAGGVRAESFFCVRSSTVSNSPTSLQTETFSPGLMVVEGIHVPFGRGETVTTVRENAIPWNVSMGTPSPHHQKACHEYSPEDRPDHCN